MTLSNKILEFNFELKYFVAYITINFLELGISSDQKDAIVLLLTDWETPFADYTNPNTHNTITITAINDLYLENKRILEGVKLQIKSNPSITLTALDYANLYIPKPKSVRSHIPAVSYAPVVTCISNSHLLPVFFVADPNHPAKRGKPKDVKAIGVKICYAGVGATPSADDYRIQQSEGRTEFEWPCPSDKVGKALWVICFYLSPTGEAGPDSNPASVTII